MAGCILPPCVVATLLARLYLEYRNMVMFQGILNSLRSAVMSMIVSAGTLTLISVFWGGGVPIRLSSTDWSLVAVFGTCVVLPQKMKIDPMLVIALAGISNVGVSRTGIEG